MRSQSSDTWLRGTHSALDRLHLKSGCFWMLLTFCFSQLQPGSSLWPLCWGLEWMLHGFVGLALVFSGVPSILIFLCLFSVMEKSLYVISEIIIRLPDAVYVKQTLSPPQNRYSPCLEVEHLFHINSMRIFLQELLQTIVSWLNFYPHP